MCVDSLVSVLSFFFSPAHTPSPKPREEGVLGQGSSCTDPGSGGLHRWRLGDTVHCPVGSGPGVAVQAHSPVHPPHSGSYIHTCACPEEGGQEKVKTFPRVPSASGHPSVTGAVRKDQHAGPCASGIKVVFSVQAHRERPPSFSGQMLPSLSPSLHSTLQEATLDRYSSTWATRRWSFSLCARVGH